MTGAAHEGGGDKSRWEGSGVSLDQPQWVKGDRVWSLKRVPAAELEVIKSKEKERHG